MDYDMAKAPKSFPKRKKTASQDLESGSHGDFGSHQAMEMKGKTDSSDDEATLDYDIDIGGPSHPADVPNYTNGDFNSDSDDDEMLQMDTESDTKRLRQTTLVFDKEGLKYKVDGRKDKHREVKRWNDADTENYRNGYPGQIDDMSLNDNLDFYTGKISSHPHGDYIDNIHNNWFGNYKKLERHHGYIQWLFPIRESGMNWQAQPLQLHEAETIRANRRAKKRVLKSYEMMLDFFGMKLDDEKTGKISRSMHWRRQFENLNWSSHNYLRITRILKSLGELGFEHLKKPFLIFILDEVILQGTLENTLKSCRDYWIGTIKDDTDRATLYGIITDADMG